MSPEELSVVHHFKANHYPVKDARFVVPLPRKPGARPLGESHSQAVHRFLTLEHSLRYEGQFEEVDTVIQEYFEQGHAKIIHSYLMLIERNPLKMYSTRRCMPCAKNRALP